MADESQGNVRREEDLATKDTADENSKAIRNEYRGDVDDIIVSPPTHQQPSTAPSKSKTGTDVKTETPEMNIKLHR